jgi:hypothetical protein
MYKLFLRLVAVSSFVVIIVSLIQLMNFTAPNPTGRRFSSQIPNAECGESGCSSANGRYAEVILSLDLKIPRNDSLEGNRACFCTSRRSSRCNTCLARNTGATSIPDFVTGAYIAEAKFTRALSLTQQLSSMIQGSRTLNMPFYLFVRVDTLVTPTLTTAVNETGGAVVYYFSHVGWKGDTTEQMAQVALVIALVLAHIAVVGLYFLTRPVIVTPIVPPVTPQSKLTKAERKVNNAEEYYQQRKQKALDDIDKHDIDL